MAPEQGRPHVADEEAGEDECRPRRLWNAVRDDPPERVICLAVTPVSYLSAPAQLHCGANAKIPARMRPCRRRKWRAQGTEAALM